MAKARKALCEMIIPGATGWERWQAPEGQAGKLVDTAEADVDVAFGKGQMKRALVRDFGVPADAEDGRGGE